MNAARWCNPLRRGLPALVLAALLCACGSSGMSRAWNGDVQRWGTLRQVLREGDYSAKVQLADVADLPGMHGIGALADLAGEVSVVDGEVWVARVRDGVLETTRAPSAGHAAAFLVLARVERWSELSLESPLDLEGLEALLEQAAGDPALAVGDSWPFLVDVSDARVEAHVLQGGCPMAEDERLRKEPHRFELAGPVQLVGFFSRLPAGQITHHGSRIHLHVIAREPVARTGHVDAARLGAGSVLKIPR